MYFDRPLSGLRALITGAAQGIGEAIVRAFFAAGADCVLHDRDQQTGAALAAELGCQFVAGDLADRAAPDRIMDAVTALGGLDVLVNNAGIEIPARLDQLESDAFAEVLEVNLIAPTALSRLSLPLLRQSANASIINVTSIHESVPVSGNGAYAAVKAGLSSFTRTAAVELGPERIRVNAIAPGAIRTRMNSDLIDTIGSQQFARWIPLGRVGAPDEIADVAVFLASPAARYITGTSLVVDGGYSNNLVRYPREAESGPTSHTTKDF
ncbi:SDR family NAD(P)-dependent oxidoreductase [Kribbella sp. NPDC004138]